MTALTQAQHARLDSLAAVRRGPWAGTRVIGLAHGGAPILRDGHNRLHVLERSGRIMGATPRTLKAITPKRERQRFPVRRFKLKKASRVAYEKRGPKL